MIAKLTSGNRVTLPKSVLEFCQGAEYFEISEDGGRIVLTPMRLVGSDAVRTKMAELGITEDDVRDAVRWARNGARKSG